MNAVDGHGNTALHYAAVRGRYDICVAILHCKPFTAVNAMGVNGSTVLHCAIRWAMRNGDAAIVRAILDCRRFTNRRAKDKFGKTAVDCAAEFGSPWVITPDPKRLRTLDELQRL